MLKKRSPLNVQRHSQRNNRPSLARQLANSILYEYSIFVLFSKSLSIVPLFSISLSPIAVIRRYTSAQLHHRAERRSRHTRTKLSKPRPSPSRSIAGIPQSSKASGALHLAERHSSVCPGALAPGAASGRGPCAGVLVATQLGISSLPS